MPADTMPRAPAPRRRPAAILAIGACALAASAQGARAQMVHRGLSAAGRVTETVSFVDAWEDGGTGPLADGLQDVLTRTETVAEPARRTASHLLLFGTWGHHLYAWDDEAVAPGMPDTIWLRTDVKAIDLDGDGPREIVLVQRSLTTRLALDDLGLPASEPGPFLHDVSVSVRYLRREAGALVEHELEVDATAPAAKALLAAELGGPLNAWVQLAAADADFAKERFEQARYRHAVVREWAEAQLTPREIEELGPGLALPDASPDAPAVLWLAATRRIAALPRWYQRR